MNSRRRWAGLLISIICFSQIFGMISFAKPDWPSDTGIMAEAGIVMDADSGAMIFGQNSKLPYYPASITKLVTALVVIENASLDERVVFSNDAVNNVESGSGNPLNLDVGDELSVKDCLYAMLLRSSNQAANALAEHVGGTRDGFVEMMNARIAQIGCTGSRFKNPSGLNDSEQVVTAYDMALIARVAFENPQLLEIASTRSYTLPATKNNPEGFAMAVEHKILKASAGTQFYCEGAVAGKTGWTSIAGSTLVTYAERDGRRLIAVVLKGDPTQYYLDTITLLEFGFSRVKTLDISEAEAVYISGDEAIAVGDASYAPNDLEFYHPYVTLPNDAEYGDAEKTFDTNLPAGSPEGAVAVLRYTYNERKVGEAFLRLKNRESEVVVASTEAGLPGETPEETALEAEPETSLEQPTKGQLEFISSLLNLNLSRNAMITLILIGIAIILALIVLIAVIRKIVEIRQEREDREVRRAIRRLRLKEEGISEEEFDRLLEARMNKMRDVGYEDDDEMDDDMDDDLEDDIDDEFEDVIEDEIEHDTDNEKEN